MRTMWIAKSYVYEFEPDSFQVAFVTEDKAVAEAWVAEGPKHYREIEEVEVR